MEFTPVTGLQIQSNFYTLCGCVLEDVIENYFYQFFNLINPHIRGMKESISGKPTDGIIRFFNEDGSLNFWILQETKRDVGIKSVYVRRSFLQALMYLGNVYYDTNILGVDNFHGIFLDSARYFIYIPKKEVDIVMEEFEPLWHKHFRVAPSQAYKEDSLNSFSIRAFAMIMDDIYPYELDESFRLDLLLREIYYNNI